MDSSKHKIVPGLTVIRGGEQRRALWRELMGEILQPRALDEAKVAEIEAKMAPRGKLSLVKPEPPNDKDQPT